MALTEFRQLCKVPTDAPQSAQSSITKVPVGEGSAAGLSSTRDHVALPHHVLARGGV